MGGALSVALCASFLVGSVLAGTRFAPLTPYVDPLVLAIITLALAAVPARSVIRAVREVVQVAPADLDAQVRRVMAEATARYGFLAHSSYGAEPSMFPLLHRETRR